MRLALLLSCLLLFGLFVYWRAGAAKDLVQPDRQAVVEQTVGVETKTDTYRQPVEDLNNAARDAYSGLE